MAARRAEPRKVSPPPDGERAWARFDSTAFLLLAVGLALSAAVLSAGTADLNGDWAAVRTSTHNWLGPAGAWLARSLVESLGTIAKDAREARRAATTERARKAPVKMLFPLVFLVLPAFLLLTVVPVLLTTVQSIR